jgi:protein PsiE
MFIYLEVLTMVGLYLSSGQLPVRMPLYIGMVALARYLVLDMKEMDAWRMRAAAVLLIRYGHVRFPYGREDESAPAKSAGRGLTPPTDRGRTKLR